MSIEGKFTAVMNRMRNLRAMFPELAGPSGSGTKRDLNSDFGYPTVITEQDFFAKYRRNGFARAAVNKTATKCWETAPVIRRDGAERRSDLNRSEKALRRKLTDLRFFQACQEADRGMLATGWAGLILRVADDKEMSEPIDGRLYGFDDLVDVIPAWSTELRVGEWHEDEGSYLYGEAKMYSYTETGRNGTRRLVRIHPSRVIVWSQDGKPRGRSLLEAGYNDLLDLEKVLGAGGEGFWKTAKSNPILNADKEANLHDVAQMMGVPIEKLADKVDEIVQDWTDSFDTTLFFKGIQANALRIQLSDPAPFVMASLQSFAASIEMPVKVLIGMQTGERASTEDATEWARTCQSRRTTLLMPLLFESIERMQDIGVIPAGSWEPLWDDLTETDMNLQSRRAGTMAKINKDNVVPVFSPEEIREVLGIDGKPPPVSSLPTQEPPDAPGNPPQPEPASPPTRVPA